MAFVDKLLTKPQSIALHEKREQALSFADQDKQRNADLGLYVWSALKYVNTQPHVLVSSSSNALCFAIKQTHTTPSYFPSTTPNSELYHHYTQAMRLPYFVLPVLGADLLDGHILLYMAPAEKGCLHRLAGCLDETALKYVALWCLTVHELLRQQNVMHADWKTGNILMDGQGWLYLADFGFTQTLSNGHAYVCCGTYLAPEVKSGGGYTPRADLYSIGCLLQLLLIAGVGYSAEATALFERWASPCPELRPDIYDPEVRTWLELGDPTTTPLLPNGELPMQPPLSFLWPLSRLSRLGEGEEK